MPLTGGCCAAMISRMRALVGQAVALGDLGQPRAFRFLHRDGALGDLLDLVRLEHQHAVLVGQHGIAWRNRHAADGDGHAELAVQEAQFGGHRRQAPGPDRKGVVADFTDIGGHAVHDDGFRAGCPGGEGNAAADRGVAGVAAPVNDQHVARPDLAECVVHHRAVEAGEPDGDRGAGDAGDLEQGVDGGIDEAEIEEMADRGRLGGLQQGDEVGVDLGGKIIQGEHAGFFRGGKR